MTDPEWPLRYNGAPCREVTATERAACEAACEQEDSGSPRGSTHVCARCGRRIAWADLRWFELSYPNGPVTTTLHLCDKDGEVFPMPAPAPGPPVDLVDVVRAWSEPTFGPASGRGPSAPLRHMAVEILAELIDDPAHLAEVWRLVRKKRKALAAAGRTQNPGDLTELADCRILLADATWRAGHTDADLVRAAEAKMVVNRARTFPRPAGDEISEHVKG